MPYINRELLQFAGKRSSSKEADRLGGRDARDDEREEKDPHYSEKGGHHQRGVANYTNQADKKKRHGK